MNSVRNNVRLAAAIGKIINLSFFISAGRRQHPVLESVTLCWSGGPEASQVRLRTIREFDRTRSEPESLSEAGLPGKLSALSETHRPGPRVSARLKGRALGPLATLL